MNSSEQTNSRTQALTFRVAKNLINLFAKPDANSEVVTQVLLNAKLVVETESNGFFYVEGPDKYRGWADGRHLIDYQSGADSNDDGSSFATVSNLVADVFSRPDVSSELSTKLVLSTSVKLVEAKLDLAAKKSSALQAIYLPGFNQTSGQYPAQASEDGTDQVSGAYFASCLCEWMDQKK